MQTAFIHISKYLNENFVPKCNKSRGLIVIIVRNIAIYFYNQRKRRASVPLYDVASMIEDEVFVTPDLHIRRLDNRHQVAKMLAESNRLMQIF